MKITNERLEQMLTEHISRAEEFCLIHGGMEAVTDEAEIVQVVDELLRRRRRWWGVVAVFAVSYSAGILCGGLGILGIGRLW